MYTVYILKSEVAHKTYVGMTDNLSRRLKEHNSKKQTYTKRFSPWKIIYTEEFITRADAHTKEKYLKSASGRRFMKSLFE